MKKFLQTYKAYYIFLNLAFLCFLIILVWLIIFKLTNLNTVFDYHHIFYVKPLSYRFIYGFSFYSAKENLSNFIFGDFLPNILVFIPFGLFLPLLVYEHRFLNLLLTSFFISLFFEVFQLFTTLGCFSVGDLISNTLGFIFGYFIYLIFNKKTHFTKITKVSFIITLISLPICIYAILRCVNTFNDYLFFVNEYLKYCMPQYF